MIGCPTRAIRRGDKGEMIVKEDMCVGCEKCARQCPYGAIQMYDLGLVPARSRGWHYLRAADVPGGGRPWYQGKLRPSGWRRGAAPFAFDRDFREGVGTTVSAGEPFCFWHTFELPEERDGWDGQLCLEVSSPPEGFKVWIDGQEVEPEGGKAAARKRTYRFEGKDAGPTGFLWWRRPAAHTVALQVVPRCAEGAVFLEVRLDVVRPPRGPWDILDDITEKAKQPKLAVVCDLCRALPAGPSCVRACPHNATLRFDARGGVPSW
jgi:Fe-S-cluster-containing hydrogenase component 2